MLATIRNDTWNVLNMQHLIPNDRTRHPLWRYRKIKGPAHMVEGDQHLRKRPHPPPTYATEGRGFQRQIDRHSNSSKLKHHQALLSSHVVALWSHITSYNLAIIGLRNGLSHIWFQAIDWTNANLLVSLPLTHWLLGAMVVILKV